MKSDLGAFAVAAEKERQYVANRMPQPYPTADGRVVVKPPQPVVSAEQPKGLFKPMTVDGKDVDIDSESLRWNDLGRYDVNTYVADAPVPLTAMPSSQPVDDMAPLVLTKGNRGDAIQAPALDVAEPSVEPTVVRQYIPAGARRYDDNITVFPLGDEYDLVFQPRYVAETELPMSVVSSDGVRLERRLTTEYTDGGMLPADVADRIFFLHGSSHLDARDMQKIREVARRAESGNYRIRVVGHASKTVYTVSDDDARRLINMAMSERRAEAVGRALERAGADVAISWRGDSEPNPHRGHRTQEAADRRVDMMIEGR